MLLVGEPFSEVKTLKEKAGHVFTTKKKLTEEEQELFDKTFRGQYIDQLEAFTKVFHRNQIFVVNIMSIVKNSTMVLEHIRKVRNNDIYSDRDIPRQSLLSPYTHSHVSHSICLSISFLLFFIAIPTFVPFFFLSFWSSLSTTR